MTQFVHYVGHAEHFTSKQKTDALNDICNEMATDGLQLVTVIPDVGGDGTTVGLWLFFALSSTEAGRHTMFREPALPRT
jgi:hypothetical protein